MRKKNRLETLQEFAFMLLTVICFLILCAITYLYILN